MTDKQWKLLVNKTSHFYRKYAATEAQQRFMCEIIEKLPEDSVVVELGVCYGMTGGLFSLASKGNYYGIDHFLMVGGYEEIVQNFQKLGRDNWELITGNTQNVPWDKPIDFLFIDAGHDEDNVKPDCERWIPFVKSGGYVAFHDWLGSKDKEINPHWAVDYYGDLATEGWKDIAHIEDQLKVKQKP